jgi:NitT/TauT family transport system permease protein
MPRFRPTAIWPPLIAGIAFIGLWYLTRELISPARKFMLPSPHAVWQAFGEHGGELLSASYNTAIGALLGFGSAIVLAIVIAITLSLSRSIRAGLYPYLMMLQMMPVIVISPILVLWVGAGLPSVTIITFLICFFPLVVNSTQGLISTDRRLVELFQMYRASRWQELRHLRIPAALPYFFTGLRIAGTLAPIGAIVGDFSAGNSAGNGGGLGFLTLIYGAQFKMAALFATVLAGCVLGFIFVAAVSVLSWWCLHQWHDSYEKTDR